METRITARIVIGSSITFVLAYLCLFLAMSCLPNIYDEGIILTGAMRVAAGQIPHRDFYANYGPAQFYILAGLFKLFGASLFIARLYDLFVRALVVSAVYAITRFYCRPWIAACSAIAAILWFIGIRVSHGAAVVPVSFLALVGSSLLPPLFHRVVSRKFMFLAGLLTGFATLFRYDVGIALLCLQVAVVAIAVYFRVGGFSSCLQPFWSALWSYLLGFAVLTVPPLVYFLAVAPVSAFIHDVLVYPFFFYPRMRRLPLPKNLGVYLPVIVAALSLFLILANWPKRRFDSGSAEQAAEHQHWLPFVLTFALLVIVTYLKGYVRISSSQMCLSSICSIPLIAVLVENRFRFSRAVRVFILSLATCIFLIGVGSSARETRELYVQKLSVVTKLLPRPRPTWIERTPSWCEIPSPLTRGLCFYPDEDRMQAIEFITGHTEKGQTLFVGVPHHDTIYGNDNLTYFATQRLPATKWSHFDPGLQNSYAVQMQMVQELEHAAPPYIVLDSEFEKYHEPNDSSKSSGVVLLDDYLHAHYRSVAIFGPLSVLRRTQGAS